jgi:hypothetical protein
MTRTMLIIAAKCDNSFRVQPYHLIKPIRGNPHNPLHQRSIK